jgi:hypothetical protein
MLGGSAWESNPPGTVLAPHTGFEVRELHQTAAHFHKTFKASLAVIAASFFYHENTPVKQEKSLTGQAKS